MAFRNCLCVPHMHSPAGGSDVFTSATNPLHYSDGRWSSRQRQEVTYSTLETSQRCSALWAPRFLDHKESLTPQSSEVFGLNTVSLALALIVWFTGKYLEVLKSVCGFLDSCFRTWPLENPCWAMTWATVFLPGWRWTIHTAALPDQNSSQGPGLRNRSAVAPQGSGSDSRVLSWSLTSARDAAFQHREDRLAETMTELDAARGWWWWTLTALPPLGHLCRVYIN